MTPAYRQLRFDAIADPEAVVVFDAARFTVLTSRLIRVEFDPRRLFEDRPSQVFWYRRRQVPRFSIERKGDELTISTDHLRLAYRAGDALSAENLTITLLPEGPVWRYGDVDQTNLLGTVRTLDKVSGAKQLELEPGLLSRAGWAVVDDSRTLVFNEQNWLEPRDRVEEQVDLYFFGYGRDFRSLLSDYCRISGNAPLISRWALGNWWSRYWAYSQSELIGLMEQFRAHEVPLSVCIIDMDWHLVNVGPGVNGWTGYTWNRALFPDPPGFLARLHELGLKTALNLHPALGVRPHEEAYPEMARRLGVDPATEQSIPFDIADPIFTQAYFEVLHHPQEKDGVDFWWMDWQQGKDTRLPGLDPLWWLNHLHFYDRGRDGRRPFIFSRWGGLGNHRYPIGFSGDTLVTWESLAFQPYFTATAANVAYGWWSHDIGGHMKGVEEPELYLRWVQFGVFSPIFRLHSTNVAFHERRPWAYDAEIFRLARRAMQLRHALIPYLYSLSWLYEKEGRALCRPLYHDYPEAEAAYACPQQYLFGEGMVVAPFVDPADADTRLSRQVVWLPPGDWYDFFNGERYQGDAWHAVYGSLEDIPVFARAGAIVPIGPPVGWGGVDAPEELHVHVFAGADGRFSLFEDDGDSLTYRDGDYALTVFTQARRGETMDIVVEPVGGERRFAPDERLYTFHVYGVTATTQVSAEIGGAAVHCEARFDPLGEILSISNLSLPQTAGLRLTLTAEAGALLSGRDRTAEKCRAMLASFRLETLAKEAVASRLDSLSADPSRLRDFGFDLHPSQLRALLEITQGVGVHHVTDKHAPHLLIIWNNRELPEMRYRFAVKREGYWHAGERFASEGGIAPRFRAITPETGDWRFHADYFGLTEISLPDRV